MRGLTSELRKFLMSFVKGHQVVANLWTAAMDSAPNRGMSQQNLHRSNTEGIYRLALDRQLLRRIEHLSPSEPGGLGDIAELTDEGWNALGLQHLNPAAPTKTTAEPATLRRRSEPESKPGDVRQAQKSLFE